MLDDADEIILVRSRRGVRRVTEWRRAAKTDIAGRDCSREPQGLRFGLGHKETARERRSRGQRGSPRRSLGLQRIHHRSVALARVRDRGCAERARCHGLAGYFAITNIDVHRDVVGEQRVVVVDDIVHRGNETCGRVGNA